MPGFMGAGGDLGGVLDTEQLNDDGMNTSQSTIGTLGTSEAVPPVSISFDASYADRDPSAALFIALGTRHTLDAGVMTNAGPAGI